MLCAILRISATVLLFPSADIETFEFSHSHEDFRLVRSAFCLVISFFFVIIYFVCRLVITAMALFVLAMYCLYPHVMKVVMK